MYIFVGPLWHSTNSAVSLSHGLRGCSVGSSSSSLSGGKGHRAPDFGHLFNFIENVPFYANSNVFFENVCGIKQGVLVCLAIVPQNVHEKPGLK